MIIYTNDYFEYDKDYLTESILANNPDKPLEDITENDIYAEFLYNDEFNIEDTKDMLESIDFNEQIIAIADLGLWDGRRLGYKFINKLSDLFTCMQDINTLEINRYNDLTLTAIHHDGTNYITFRTLKSDLSDTQIENFTDKLYYNTATQKDITRYTKSIGKIVRDYI